MSTADEHVRLKVQQGETRRRRSHQFHISDHIQQIELSNPVQSISKSYEHGLFKHRSSQVKKKRATVLTDVYYTKLWRDQVIEDLTTKYIILDDVTQVIHWRPHLGGDC